MRFYGNAGFSAILVLLIAAIVGLVSAAGYYVYSQNTKEPTKTSVVQDDGSHSDLSRKYSYSLPTGWAEINCGVPNSEISDVSTLAFPENNKAEDCDDRTDTILFSSGGIAPGEEPTCYTLEEVNRGADDNSKPRLDAYSCEILTIADTKVVTQTSSQPGGYDMSEGSIFSYTSYSFYGKEPLLISYYGDGQGNMPYASDAENIARSVKFSSPN